MGKSDKKRKRDSDVHDDEASKPAQKVQVLEDGAVDATKQKSEKTSDRRQIKSERKKKRDLEAKHNGATKKQKMQATTTTGADDLAAGQDFVSLGGADEQTEKKPSRSDKKLGSQNAAFTAQSRDSRAGFKKAAAKRSSPRSIRKAEKVKKIESAMVEAGLGDRVEPSDDAGAADGQGKKSSRFLVFVGNLPYSTTTAEIEAHFAKLTPAAVRHMTDKSTGKSKGYAFLEFTHYDQMKTCLSLYHQSVFDPHNTGIIDEVDGADEGEDGHRTKKSRKDQGSRKSKKGSSGRRINVELTAGGGGNSSQRTGKIKKKNKKLFEERQKARINLAKKQQAAEEEKRKKSIPGATGANAERPTGAGAAAPAPDGMEGLHPSRLARVRG